MQLYRCVTLRVSRYARNVPTAPAFKRLPRAVREQQMLDSAVRVFAKRGFHAASMDEIAEQAGISKPMVYAYLGSKEELFVACLRRETTRLVDAVTATAHLEEAPPDRQLWRGLKAFLQVVGEHRQGWTVLYRQAHGWEPFSSELSTLRSQVADAVAGLLGRALTSAGRRVSDGELEVMAYALVGAAESVADWLGDRPGEDPDRVTRDLAAVLRAICPVGQDGADQMRGGGSGVAQAEAPSATHHR